MTRRKIWRGLIGLIPFAAMALIRTPKETKIARLCTWKYTSTVRTENTVTFINSGLVEGPWMIATEAALRKPRRPHNPNSSMPFEIGKVTYWYEFATLEGKLPE